MKRRRTPLLVMACALAVLTMATTAFAQRGGGGGGPGGFGGGPGGFGGGPGGRGGNNDTGSHLLTLAEDSAVWDEIKVTDEQLGKITRLKSTISKSSRAFRNKLRAEQQAARDQQQQQTAATGVQVDPAARDAAREAARQLERQATAENNVLLQQDTDASLKKILTKPGPTSQFARLQQIDLQEAGPLVVARPDVAKALNLSPAQIDQVSTIIEQMKQGQDQVDQNRRQFFDSMRQSGGFGGPGGGGPGGGGPGGGGPGGGGPGGGAPGGGAPGGGGPGGGGRRGGNNNNNANTPPMTDAEREARRLQFQTAMEQMQTDSQSVRDKAVKMVSAALTKKQKEKFNQMLGKPFDLTLLNDGRGPDNPYNPARNRGRGPGGGGPPGAPGTGATGTVAAAGTATATSGTTGATATSTANAKAAQTKGTTKTQPKTATPAKTAGGTAKAGTPK